MAENLRETILQSPSGQRMIDSVSPIYDNSYVGLWLFQAMGSEWDMLWDVIESLPDQLYPSTVTWAIELWERRYGLPIPSGKTLEERRANIILKCMAHLPMNPAQIEKIANNVTGCKASVKEHTGPFTFTLYMADMKWSLMKALKRAINAAKPSHISYDVHMYSKTATATAYAATRAWSVKGRFNLPTVERSDQQSD